MKALAIALLFAGCAQKAPSGNTASERVALGGERVAKVGSVVISREAVTRAARARGVTPQEARDALIADTLAAEGALGRELDKAPAVAQALRAARGRGVVERIRERALEQGPPTDEEVTEMSRERWATVDSPERIRAVHAVATRPNPPTAEGDARAKEVAQKMAEAAAHVKNENEFETRVREVPQENVKVVVEQLPWLVVDGRVVDGPMMMDPAFTAGAFKTETGTTSGVVESSFGWHVLYVIERKPAISVPFEDRRALFRDEITMRRMKKALDELHAAARKSHPVVVTSDLESLFAALIMTGTP